MERVAALLFLSMTGTNRASLSSALGALGVVYGDIGTSVLYAFRECLSFGVSQHNEGVLGIFSLIIWTLILLGTVKYLTFVTRADIMARGAFWLCFRWPFPRVLARPPSRNWPG
jgi:K+ transporter